MLIETPTCRPLRWLPRKLFTFHAGLPSKNHTCWEDRVFKAKPKMSRIETPPRYFLFVASCFSKRVVGLFMLAKLPLLLLPIVRLMGAFAFFAFLSLSASDAIAGPGHTKAASIQLASGETEALQTDTQSGAPQDHSHEEGSTCCMICTAALTPDGPRADLPALGQSAYKVGDGGRSFVIASRLERPPRG